MNAPRKLTLAIVRDLLEYDPEIDELRWKKRGKRYFKHARAHGQLTFNLTWAGKVAGNMSYVSGPRQITILGQTYPLDMIKQLYHAAKWIDETLPTRQRKKALRAAKQAPRGRTRSPEPIESYSYAI